MAVEDRYRTDALAIVRVRCKCGHFDTIAVKAGAIVTVDGTYEKCAACLELTDPAAWLAGAREAG